MVDFPKEAGYGVVPVGNPDGSTEWAVCVSVALGTGAGPNGLRLQHHGVFAGPVDSLGNRVGEWDPTVEPRRWSDKAGAERAAEAVRFAREKRGDGRSVLEILAELA